MLRSLLAACTLFWTTTVSAQVIFAPVEPYVPPEYEVSPRVLALLYSLHWPRTYVSINVSNGAGANVPSNPYPTPIRQGSILIIPAGPSISPEAAGVDPLTGQPLYFRKRDLLPPEAVAPPPAAEEPAAQPQTAPADPNSPAKRGEIIIKPWRGGGVKLTSR